MHRSSIAYIFAVLVVAPAVFGQDELDSLDQAIVEVTESSIDALQLQVQELERKNAQLNADLQALQEQLTLQEEERVLKSTQSMLHLREENEQLRKSIRLLYGGRVENLPTVPMPNRELLQKVLSDGQLQRQYEEKREVLDPEPEMTDEPAVPFRVIKEWGRTPEAVAEMGGNLSTLKGMSIFMQPDTSREDMEAYARRLHEEHAHYDNLNIEVFDQEEAANQFAAKGKLGMAFRVMSISKHAKTGRDVILVGRGSSMEDIH